MKNILSRFQFVFLALLCLILGFLIGKVDFVIDSKIQREVAQPETEIPQKGIINFKEIVGDELRFTLAGEARVIFGSEKFIESEGEGAVLLSQIPSQNDLPFLKFPFTGNTKTMKFYPSNSYFARGVEVKSRRFFATKAAALSAGFIATKGVK